MTTPPVAAVQALAPAVPAMHTTPSAGIHPPDFGQLMVQGLHQVNAALAGADASLRAVAMGEPVAPHQAMLAMEHARLELQLALQVRNRLLEGVQELMRMQL